MFRSVPFLVLLLISVGDAKRTICMKKGFAVEKIGFYQRIESSSPNDCVERCIESWESCKSVVYIQAQSKRHKPLCQLYNVNSETDYVLLRQVSRHEPQSTIFEILDSCPSKVADQSRDFFDTLSPSLRRILNGIPTIHRRISGQFERRDDLGKETYLAPEKPLYPFNGSKIKSKTSSENFDNDLNANGGDAGAPVPRKQEPLRPIQPVVGQQQGAGQALSAFAGNVDPNKGAYLTGPQGFARPGFGGLCPNGVCAPIQPPGAYPAQIISYPSGVSYPCSPLRPPYECGNGAARPTAGIELPKEVRPTWSEWLPVGTCSVTCGKGVRMRKRTCSTGNEDDCDGDPSKDEPCIQPECNVWSEWTEWGRCSASCGGGTKTRTRVCRNGQDCVGPREDVRECAEEACPQWTNWTPWGECSSTCGQGVQRRIRECIPPGSAECKGPSADHQPCENKACPTWGQWERWSECSKTCGMGERVRRRECLNGLGDDCLGPHEEHLLCNPQPCPEWTQWTPWGQCSKSCGDEGSRLRTRECRYEGVPSAFCEGTAQDQSACQLDPCPHWGSWSSWTGCSATCGHGQQTRQRECEPKGFGCTGGDREIRFCQQAVCPYWDQWSEWTTCSESCGRGLTSRKRKCVKDDVLPGAVLPSDEELGGAGLDGLRPEPSPEQEDDNDGPEVEPVTESSREGSSDDNDAIKARLIERAQRLKNSTTTKKNRSTKQKARLQEQVLEVTQSAAAERRRAPIKATVLELRDAPEGCPGADSEQKECDAGPCCEWSSWSAWTDCNNPCHSGQRLRSRSCQVQVPFHTHGQGSALGVSSGEPPPPAPANYINIYARPPQHDHVKRYTEEIGRSKRQAPFGAQPGTYLTAPAPQIYANQPFVQPIIGQQTNNYPQAVNAFTGVPAPSPFGASLGTGFPAGPSLASPFGKGCECPGKAVETDQCDASEVRNACGNGAALGTGQRGKGQQEGGGKPFGQIQVQPAAVSGHSKSGQKGKGSSTEITSYEARDNNDRDSLVMAVNQMMLANQKCEWGSWGPWNTCRGSCEKGHKARTRACKQKESSGGDQSYDVKSRVARASPCECDGDDVETEDCTPAGCEIQERDQPMSSERENRDLTKEDEDPVLSCYWSEWTDWGHCGKDLLRKRTRLCVGLKALLTNCECMGPSVQQTACSAPNLDKKPSAAVLAVSRDILQDRLEKKPRNSKRHNNKDEDEKIDQILDSLDSCEWLSWTEWTQCNAPCDGEGERRRTRTCPCRTCQSGMKEQVESCRGDPCLSAVNHKKYPFDE
ncbi:unnamed protein product [Bursaphelenchus xylophilus]|uniref:(pine wood nematode) hypothetical protein n=1 Tax=Bursaphelenchus xylophilus TaxID=6326 RepID=A0A1I7SLS0_BURXY|nr:unnamed protein product [Bursaphelenchus xylophilus]CAG9129716.1 unnamed protein product [Bursaphelenchus xylophilus]